ncbi:YczE/YyaS/YitT family protein [Halobacillus halophilus]|uniref:YczE/YyaS/YitT family protein n=1 Tax=Halobacillus halophilus TaxID=1570 RepID=UPI001CD52F4A|nr:YitT family protein [Halobacillus halophilus]MCA1011816.1 YitT family protein [Halobacillus halophilus]
MLRIWQRGFYYSLGIVLLTFGIALTIESQLGTSPFDALLVGLYRSFGLTIGSWEIVVGLTIILFNAAAQRKRPELLALATSLLTGIGIDLWLWIIRSNELMLSPNLLAQILCLLTGILFASLGIAINLQADFAPNPFDRMMLVVRKLTGWTITTSRVLISILLVVAAALFGGAIGVGTILITLLSGPAIHGFMNLVNRLDQRLAPAGS